MCTYLLHLFAPYYIPFLKHYQQLLARNQTSNAPNPLRRSQWLWGLKSKLQAFQGSVSKKSPSQQGAFYQAAGESNNYNALFGLGVILWPLFPRISPPFSPHGALRPRKTWVRWDSVPLNFWWMGGNPSWKLDLLGVGKVSDDKKDPWCLRDLLGMKYYPANGKL